MQTTALNRLQTTQTMQTSPVPRSPPLLLRATTLSHFKQLHAHFLLSALFDFSAAAFLSGLLSLSSSSSSSSSSSAAAFNYALDVLDYLENPRLYNRALITLNSSSSNASFSLSRRSMAVYEHMRQAGLLPDRFAIPSLLGAVVRDHGDDGEAVAKEAHGLAVKLGMDEDGFVQTTLVKVYAKHGTAEDARKVFDRMLKRDVVAWNVMLDSYRQGGLYKEALLLFREMKSSGVVPDQVILTTVLSACSRMSNLALGKALHSYILESNIRLGNHLQSGLVNMYASCGSMDIAQRLYDEISSKNVVAATAMVFGYAKVRRVDEARYIFDKMLKRDLISWSAMISGYVESDHPTEALELFNQMQASGVRPDEITMLSVISACAQVGALDQAKWMEMFVHKNQFSRILTISNALIDMYSKCGCLASARRIFDKMSSRNVITWTSMITSHAMHGDGHSALLLFDQMKAEGVQPNEVTFLVLLYSCSHSGLVVDGRRIFQLMSQEYRIEPKLEHYGCMIDILGRAKHVNEAFKLVESMPYRPNVIVWGSLLGACRIHGKLEHGETAAKKLLELDPDHDGAYVLLSNIYAKANRWDDVRMVRKLMQSRSLLKERGCSWIEWDGHVHEFVMDDASLPESCNIHTKLNEVTRELEVAGYAPHTECLLVNLQEEEKKGAVLLHSEKLALCFGLIKSSKSSCIHIAKNVRVCEDCHSFMKRVSKVYDREIILRDRIRFHHFMKGQCSCKDFW